jgi:hypothetical protein
MQDKADTTIASSAAGARRLNPSKTLLWQADRVVLAVMLGRAQSVRSHRVPAQWRKQRKPFPTLRATLATKLLPAWTPKRPKPRKGWVASPEHCGKVVINFASRIRVPPFPNTFRPLRVRWSACQVIFVHEYEGDGQRRG